jgi:hypothetical protein
MPAEFDARRAFRVRDGRVLVALGGALAVVALLLTALATHDISQKERSIAGLEARRDSLRSMEDTASNRALYVARLAQVEFTAAAARERLDAARERRDSLWTWTGSSTLLAALGGLLVGAGLATLRRARLTHRPPPE